MYHVGKIVKVLKPSSATHTADNSIQAHIEMWDENEIIVTVHPALNSEIKEKDIVLVRYTQPEPIVMKIFEPKEGKQMWEKFSELFERKKRSSQQANFRDNPASRMIG